MRILIYMPLAPQRPRLYARSLQSVLTMHWDEYCDVVLGREDIDPYPQEHVKNFNLLDKYNHARDMALAGDYDALLTVEYDVIVPPLTLLRLTKVDADVAYGLYVSRHGFHKWLAADHLHATGSWASLSDDKLLMAEAWGKVVRTVGVGMGCTLIHRHVLEDIDFRCPDPMVATDWYFSLDLQERDYVQKHDCGVICGHIQGAPSPKIYWPDPETGYSVQFFDEAMPERVKLMNGHSIIMDHFGTKELFPAPDDAYLHAEVGDGVHDA